MLRFLYSLLLIFSVPLILLRLYWRGYRVPGYWQRISERFGRYTPSSEFDLAKTTIWIHAVSVGETIAAEPLVKALSQTYPTAQILLTYMTPTGADRVDVLFGDTIFHGYLPYDLPTAVNRFLTRIKPNLLIIMETELWPNLIHQCKKRGVKIILANARLSEKSVAGYARFSGLTKPMLQSINAIAAQSTQDANRFLALGAPADKIFVTGSLKFNVEQDSKTQANDSFFNFMKNSDRTVLIAASTREGEEVKVISAYKEVQRTIPNTLLLLVPRHPERFAEVGKLCEKNELTTICRSSQRTADASTQVILGDSMGEMFDYYSVADIAFVGGSLVDTGCQNVLEPAALALPVVVGPSQFNFEQICKQLESAGGLKTVANEQELATFLVELIEDEFKRNQMGLAARSVIDANQQALPALLSVIEKVFSE
ncbi:MAG: lipid IV(A) 3-deoxy-D-manno-octulosonic acid transferase [Pseudomonadales bacterium]|nr:lipid IV(A) 3-deoxy-D-manno-octulosonic acid transferase [Pseudomonadales bacterium]